MKAETFFDAIGMLGDDIIEDARNTEHTHISFIKPISIAAALFLVLTLPLPAAVAFGSETAYNLLYSFSPSIAQASKPIMRSCTDNGIRIEVVSADIEGSKARIFLSVKDMEQNRIDKSADLFDSYTINCPFDSVSHCSFSEYDESTSTAFFLVEIERMDGKDIDIGKITFRVKEMIFGKETFSGVLTEIDTTKIISEPETLNSIVFRGGYSKYDIPNYEDYSYLIPNDTLSYSPVDGVVISGIGCINDMLHIQTYYEDILHTDNHGHIYLMDKQGNRVEPHSVYDEFGISFWDAERSGSYDEQIIDIPYDKISEYQLYGEFVTSKGYANGDWEITFPIE